MGESELSARLDHLEERIARLEARAPHPARDVVSAPASVGLQPSFDAAVAAKSILIVGGAYVLRALTETHLLPDAAGVALGFTYALVWIAMSRNVFYAATAAAIAGALSWEAAARFHIIGAAGGAVLIAIAALVLLWTARRRSSAVHAIVAGALSIAASIGVAIGTGDALPAMLTVAGIGILISTQRDWEPLIVAAVAGADDSIAITLVAVAYFGKAPHDRMLVNATLLMFAIAWLIVPLTSAERARWPEMTQAVAATAIGLGGSALLGGGLPLLAAALLISIACYSRAFGSVIRPSLAIAGAIALLFVLWGPWMPALLSIAAVVAAIASRRWPLLSIQSAAFATVGAIAAWSSPVTLLVCAACAAASVMLVDEGIARLVLLAVVTGATATAVSSSALQWTAVLAIAIAVLSRLANRMREAGTLALGVLVMTGIKLIAIDLRVSSAATLVASLALYGVAMLVFARRRTAPHPAFGHPLPADAGRGATNEGSVPLGKPTV